MRPTTIVAFVLALSVSALAAPAFATVTPTFTAIDYPGATSTSINGVTRAGPMLRSADMVGTYDDINGAHGFVLSAGGFTTLDVPVPYAVNTQAHGINAKHQVVGWYYMSSWGGWRGFSYKAGTYTRLRQCSQTDYSLFEPYGINTNGLIVGTQLGAGNDNNYHNWGFVQGGSTCTNFNLPNAQGTQIYGINDSNTSVGTFTDANSVVHGAVFTPPPNVIESTFDFPLAMSTIAYGINNSGVIVGTCETRSRFHIRGGGVRFTITKQGFVYSGGVFSTINFPGGANTEVHAVNDPDPLTGTYQIVGSYVDDQGNLRGYIASISPFSSTSSSRLRHSAR